MTNSFEYYVLKYTRSQLNKKVKTNEISINGKTKASILKSLKEQNASEDLIEEFKSIWEEYSLIFK